MEGPCCPGSRSAGADPNGKPLFASIAESPIASASLGQVYRAELRDDFDLGSINSLRLELLAQTPITSKMLLQMTRRRVQEDGRKIRSENPILLERGDLLQSKSTA